MGVQTSTSFVSAAASGENWRDISKKVLEQLESVKTDGFRPNIGFLYITEELAADAQSILTLFRSVTGIDNWSGCSAMGVCGSGVEYADVPGISVLIGMIPADQVRGFHVRGQNFKALHQELEPWLNTHDPMLVIVHADPYLDAHPAQALEEIEAMVGGFMVGGLASSEENRAIFGRDAAGGGIGGFIFDERVAVATTLSQGCIPMGQMHEISKSDDHMIAYLDGKPAFDVFSAEMKALVESRLGQKAGEVVSHPGFPQADDHLLRAEAHIAFPVTGSDQKDYMVRNIMAIDPDTGAIAVAEQVEDGQNILFVHRDDETMKTDLAQTLVALQRRVQHDQGRFAPKAALYISCIARAGVRFKGGDAAGGEMALLKDVLGDIPIAGFYANGEISNNRLYGYTGVLTLFL